MKKTVVFKISEKNSILKKFVKEKNIKNHHENIELND
jgi:hypothetical protein